MSRPLPPDEVEKFLQEAPAGRLGLSRAGIPYVVPLCYVYCGDRVYLHSGGQGRKIDYIRANHRACFQVDRAGELVQAERPCKFNLHYRSVLVEGTISLVSDGTEKLQALLLLAAKYGAGQGASLLTEAETRPVTVLRLDITRVSGRINP